MEVIEICHFLNLYKMFIFLSVSKIYFDNLKFYSHFWNKFFYLGTVIGTELNDQNIGVAAAGVEKEDVEAAAGMLDVVLFCIVWLQVLEISIWCYIIHLIDSTIKLFSNYFL